LIRVGPRRTDSCPVSGSDGACEFGERGFETPVVARVDAEFAVTTNSVSNSVSTRVPIGASRTRSPTSPRRSERERDGISISRVTIRINATEPLNALRGQPAGAMF
jgi:hypothetical protein